MGHAGADVRAAQLLGMQGERVMDGEQLVLGGTGCWIQGNSPALIVGLTQRAEEKLCGGNCKSELQGQRQEMQGRESVPFHVAYKWNKTVRRTWRAELAGKLEMGFKQKALDAFVLCFMP